MVTPTAVNFKAMAGIIKSQPNMGSHQIHGNGRAHSLTGCFEKGLQKGFTFAHFPNIRE
jgi:hypothetical protein